MKPTLKLQLNRETLRLIEAQDVPSVDGAGKFTLATCRIVSCALACPSGIPALCNI